MPDLHPAVAALAPLLGNWSGRGSGEYPTIEPFGYTEEVDIGHTGKPFLTYSQRTRSDDGSPLHAETGYIRMPSRGRIELVIAQPTGVTEIDEGTVTTHGPELMIHARSTTVGLTATAKEVLDVARSFRVAGDEMRYTLEMGAVGLPLQHHLAATLHRRP
ncbi:MAG: FABP family protein [Mycobacterium sp.]